MRIIILFLCLIINILSRKLILVQNLFRHGARYPTFVNDDDFTNEPKIKNNIGQLTSQGKNMHYLLGKILYQKYWKNLFQGTQAQFKYDHKLIYVKSTNLNRTIQSVQSQLRGWLENLTPLQLQKNQLDFSMPAFENLETYIEINNTVQNWKVFNQTPKYQTFPIHTGNGDQHQSGSNPYDQGDFLLKQDSVNCPKQYQWQIQNYNSPMGKKIINMPQVKQALQKLAQSFPNNEVTFQNAYMYIDNYVCMQYMNQPTLKIFSDPKYQRTLNYIKQVSLYLSQYYQPIQYRTISTNLFQNIVVNFKKAIDQTGPKLILYSAHDTTVAMALAAFNLTNVNCINDKYLNNAANQQTCVSEYPRFSANFVIQVYKEDNQTYTFDIVFNNIQRRIPFCDYQFSCSVQKFYAWVDSWKIEDPNKQCGIIDNFKVQIQKQKKSRLNLYIVIGIQVIIIVVLLVILINQYSKKRKQQKQKQGYIQNFEQKQHQNQQMKSFQINDNIGKQQK